MSFNVINSTNFQTQVNNHSGIIQQTLLTMTQTTFICINTTTNNGGAWITLYTPLGYYPINSNTSNVNPDGTVSTGSTGLFADAGHIHPRCVFTYYASLSASQTTSLTAGSPVKFNTLSSDSGSGAPAISLSGSTYQFTLPTGFKYEFIGQVGDNTFSATAANASFQMYNNTSSVYFGSCSFNLPATYTAANYDAAPVFVGELSNTSGSNVVVSAVINTNNSLSNIKGGTGVSATNFLKITATKL